jgi:hypothetical protein
VVITRWQWQCLSKIRQILSKPVLVATAVTDREEDDVMHYLAVRGIQTTTSTFYSPVLYTPILAQMLWMCRLVLLEITVSDHVDGDVHFPAIDSINPHLAKAQYVEPGPKKFFVDYISKVYLV